MTTLPRRVLHTLDRFNAAHPWDHNAHYHRWILRQLPGRFGSALDVGAGSGDLARLMALAKRQRPQGLELWTFQANAGARRFYERHGFVAVERTGGRRNEEREPDIRYVWRP